MIMCRLKNLLIAFLVVALLIMAKITIAATIIIENNIAPIQIGATISDNGGNPGNPSINIWAPGSGGGGGTVYSGGSYQYPDSVDIGSSANFGIQVNSARLPEGGECDQLCNHIQISINRDGTCSAANAEGTCGSNENAPRWSAVTETNMSGGTCTVTIEKAITPPTVCGCKDGKYPCTTSVVCGGSTGNKCPLNPPYQW